MNSYKHVDDVYVSCLCVTEPPRPVWPTVLSAVLLGTLIILAAAYVCYIWMRNREGEECVCVT